MRALDRLKHSCIGASFACSAASALSWQHPSVSISHPSTPSNPSPRRLQRACVPLSSTSKPVFRHITRKHSRPQTHHINPQQSSNARHPTLPTPKPSSSPQFSQHHRSMTMPLQQSHHLFSASTPILRHHLFIHRLQSTSHRSGNSWIQSSFSYWQHS